MGLKEQYEYNDAYQKQHITRIVVKFNDQRPRDVEILRHLRTQESIQKYIKDVVEADMKK